MACITAAAGQRSGTEFAFIKCYLQLPLTAVADYLNCDELRSACSRLSSGHILTRLATTTGDTHEDTNKQRESPLDAKHGLTLLGASCAGDLLSTRNPTDTALVECGHSTSQ